MSRMDDLRRMAARETDECVIWPYAKASNGYSSLAGVRGHSLVCGWYHGPPPFERAHAAHTCDVRLCVNPRHLRWATSQENVDDTKARPRLGPFIQRPRGQVGTGSGAHLRKLSWNEVDEIRRLWNEGGVTMRALGEQFGTTHSAISKIINGKTWKALEHSGT